MRSTLLVFTVSILFSYCNNENKETTQTKEDKKQVDKQDSITVDVSGCYRRIIARDSFTAVFEQRGNAINGRLVFDNYEKDGSSGDVKGKLEGDILKLIYTFNSEGMKSVMHVYFRYQNNKLIRGIGDMDVKGDTAYFKKPDMIVYPEDEVWQKVSCNEVSLNR